MPSTPPLLLLTSSPPGRRGVGQVYIRDMCRLFPPGAVACFAPLARSDPWQPEALSEGVTMPMQTAVRRFEPAFAPVRGFLGQALAWAGQQTCFVPHARRLAGQAAAFAEALSTSAVWAVLDCPTTIEMAEPLARRLGVPLYTLVWDAPEIANRSFGHRGMSLRHLLRRFDRAVRASERVAVVSQLLQQEYQTRYGVETVLLRHALDPALIRSGLTLWQPDRPFVIGYAGAVMSAGDLQTLQVALDSAGWRIGRREVTLRLFGSRYVLQAAVARRIEYRGLLDDTPEVVAALAECDIAYLPQPFDPQLRQLARWSFPTKLSTYLAAGRPVLVHSPPDSSTACFCREHPVGACCTAADAASLLATLLPLAEDPQAYARATAEAQATCQSEFHVDVTRRQLFRFLGLEGEDGLG